MAMKKVVALPHAPGVPEGGMHIQAAPTCPARCPECDSGICREPIGSHNADDQERPIHVCISCGNSYVIKSIKPLPRRRL